MVFSSRKESKNFIEGASSERDAILSSSESNTKSRTVYYVLLCLIVYVIIHIIVYNIEFDPEKDIDINDTIIDRLSVFSEVKSADKCSILPDEKKFDCFPRGVPNSDACAARGCCWSPKQNDINVPWCYYPESFETYRIVNKTQFKTGENILLNSTWESPYPNNVPQVKLVALYETKYRLHVKITDSENHRFEPPYPELPLLSKRPTLEKDYNITFDDSKFGFTVTRNKTGEVIFDTRNVGAFIFSDQFLQITALLPTKYIYGLGEHRNEFLLNTDWNRITLFNHDSIPTDGVNGYGTHPFLLGIEESGFSYGVFLLNSNAMDIILQPGPSITYRTIGGVFDFYFFLGPTPTDVIGQYTELLGRPFLPPYWSLGFHLCRFGWKSLNDTVNVWNRMRNAKIPFDVQWNDIDYMDNRNDFTLSENYAELPAFVNHLHEVGMKYIMIVDPGVSSREPPGSYSPYDDGLKLNIFIKNASGYPLEGEVWNTKGGTVFPDFTDPKVVTYWTKQMGDFFKKVPFDGIWLDMNEISNFVNGSYSGCGNTSTHLEYPPYVPAVDHGVLNYHTLCMSAVQYAGLHYNVHNLHGFAETMVTSFVLAEILQERPFIISRSTFAGFGHYAGHWTGDVLSTWDDMKHSVYDIMSFNLFGIPMVGADICGFNGNTTVELCQRWSQLGAFYPFSRNHNSDGNIDQDPVALGPEVVQSAKKALLLRYSLLPYLYSLFWKAYTIGETVVRPLFFEFLNNTKIYEINTQFMWGPAIMIVPVLDEGHTSVNAFIPADDWYIYHMEEILEGKNDYVNISAPLDTIPILIRAGYVVPFQKPDVTTTLSRQNGFVLLMLHNRTKQASGFLYWDDGVSYNAWDEMQYNLMSFELQDSVFTSSVKHWGYGTKMKLDEIVVVGLNESVTSVKVNGTEHKDFVYLDEDQTLYVRFETQDLSESFIVSWT